MSEAHWQVFIHCKAEKILKRLDGETLERIRRALRSLANEPRPAGVRKLTGHDNLYRLRVGDWCIIYAIEDDRLIVLVLEISTRGNAYRNL
ncbi:MAG: type II toxin-antitoxin system RelE/ParE family toxin [Anaerolineales bacterium]|nr:type II toxin-antitoxin system RelE/ParE family toxin [Anaerolineales bacterium]